MSPIEVSENPRRAKSFRLASRIFVLARGSPRRGRVIFGPSLGDWSASSHRRDYPKQLPRQPSPDLFGKLVPPLAISDPSPQLPAAGLRGLFEQRPQSAQPVGHHLRGVEPRQPARKFLTTLA